MSNCWCQRAIIMRPVACFPNTYLSRVNNDPPGWVIAVDRSNKSMKYKSQIKCFCKTLINIKTK